LVYFISWYLSLQAPLPAQIVAGSFTLNLNTNFRFAVSAQAGCSQAPDVTTFLDAAFQRFVPRHWVPFIQLVQLPPQSSLDTCLWFSGMALLA
jgi:hypothetical protein